MLVAMAWVEEHERAYTILVVIAFAFGLGVALLGVAGDLTRGDGFDWVYVTLGLVGGTVGWFTLLWLGDRFNRWAKKYGERHGLS
jgi:hypothetical protein